MLPTNIPKYISTFELEEARLGQTLEKCKLSHDHAAQEILKQCLRIIRENSINAEYALETVFKKISSEESNSNEVNRFLLIIENLMQILLKKSP